MVTFQNEACISIAIYFSIGFALSANAQFLRGSSSYRCKNNVTWLRCSVGQTWDLEDKTCDGI